MMSDNYVFRARVSFAIGADLKKWIRERLPGLPSSIRPTYFGDGETPIRSDDWRVDNTIAFDRYIASRRSELGFFGDDFWADFQLYSEEFSRLTVYASEGFELHCCALFAELDAVGAEWGGAGTEAELESRNYLKVEAEYAATPGGYCTGWRGRDHRRYVPGLYWLNYWSREYVKMHDVDPHTIMSALGGEVTALQNGIVLRLYDRAADWVEKRGHVDDFLEASPAFFSMRRVRVPRLRTPMDTKKFIETAREWP